MNSRAKGSDMARNTVCTTIFTVLALSACAPEEGRSTFAVENMVLDFSTDATSAIRHEVTGYAQKGPFTSDASVRITKLDDALQPTDIHNSTYISGPLGEFELDVHFEGDALVSAAGTANCDKNEYTTAKYAPETAAWRLHSRYHRRSAVSYARLSRVSHAKDATTRTLATASCATAFAAASASCVARAFSVIHSPYSLLASATKGTMAHARSPSPIFWTQR